MLPLRSGGWGWDSFSRTSRTLGDNDMECLASWCDNPCVHGAGRSHLIHTTHQPEPLQVHTGVLPSLGMDKPDLEMSSVPAGIAHLSCCFPPSEAAHTAGSFPCVLSTMEPKADPNLTAILCGISLWSCLPWQHLLQPSEQLRALGKYS